MLRLQPHPLASPSVLLAFFCLGCGDASPPALATILGLSKVAAPIDPATGLVSSCEYFASPSEFTTEVVLDTAFAQQLTLPFTVRNDAEAESQGLRPLRMNTRWECDSNGFGGELGPLVVPAIDPTLPFCDPTGLEDSSFVGFDVVPASGPRIPGGGGLAITLAQVIPYSLGSAIDQTFSLGVLAERCCDESRAGNCDGRSADVACAQLVQVFSELDPLGTALQVEVEVGPSEDLLRFRPFAIFDGGALCARDPAACDSTTLMGPAYRMRLRGSLELLDAKGEIIRSDEVTTDIDSCRNCGYWNGQQRFPASQSALQCFAR